MGELTASVLHLTASTMLGRGQTPTQYAGVDVDTDAEAQAETDAHAALVSDNVDGTHNCRCASSSHVACITWSLGERGVRVRDLLARRAGNQLNTTAKAQSPLAKRQLTLLHPPPLPPLFSPQPLSIFIFASLICVCECVHFG